MMDGIPREERRVLLPTPDRSRMAGEPYAPLARITVVPFFGRQKLVEKISEGRNHTHDGL